MKFFLAIATYLLLGVILCAGILQAVHGSYWLLIFAGLGYVLLLGLLGCLPPRSATDVSRNPHPTLE